MCKQALITYVGWRLNSVQERQSCVCSIPNLLWSLPSSLLREQLCWQTKVMRSCLTTWLISWRSSSSGMCVPAVVGLVGKVWGKMAKKKKRDEGGEHHGSQRWQDWPLRIQNNKQTANSNLPCTPLVTPKDTRPRFCNPSSLCSHSYLRSHTYLSAQPYKHRQEYAHLHTSACRNLLCYFASKQGWHYLSPSHPLLQNHHPFSALSLHLSHLSSSSTPPFFPLAAFSLLHGASSITSDLYFMIMKRTEVNLRQPSERKEAEERQRQTAT